MDGVLTQKTISFLGSWKCERISDHLLHEIATHSNRIKGNTTKFQVSKAGINLIAVDGSGQLGKSTLIPLSNIYNVTVNRFKPECLLCVVRDEPKRLSVVVCRCKTEKDITDIIQAFNAAKRSQTGQGFNTNIRKLSGQNWSLNSRQDVDEGNNVHFSSTEEPKIAITQNGNRAFQSGTTLTVLQQGNKSFTDTAVQTETEEDLDSASSLSSATVKEELIHLSQDVRAIKRMIELSTGISEAQHFKRISQMSHSGQQIRYEEMPVFHSQDQVLRTSREGKFKGRDVVIKGKSTKIIPDHDIRSFAVQTDHRYQNLSPAEVSAFSYGNAPYIQRSVGGSVSSTSSSMPGAYSRQRIGSNSSTNSDAVFLQYQRSPGIVGEHDKIGRVSYFITPPPGRGDKSKSLQVRHYYQKEQRPSAAVLSTTIPRSIENVYSGKRYRKNQERARVVVTPRTFVNGEMHRKTSDSEKRTVIKGERTILGVSKGGSDSSLEKRENSLQEIHIGEESGNVQLFQSEDLKIQDFSNSQEIPKIVDFVENDDEKLNRETVTNIESYNYAPQTQETVIVENIIRSGDIEEEHATLEINGDSTEQDGKAFEAGDRNSAGFNTVLTSEPFEGNNSVSDSVLVSDGFDEGATESSTILSRETYGRSSVEYNSVKTPNSIESDTVGNRDLLESDTTETRDSFEIDTAQTVVSSRKSRNGSNSVSFKEPEVFLITSEELDSVSKSPNFASKKQETSFDFEQKSEGQESASKSPNFASKQTEYSFDFQQRASIFRNADVKTADVKSTTKNTEVVRRKAKPTEEIREKSGKQPEVFYITDDDLESACKTVNIPREYYEVDSVQEDSTDEQERDLTVLDTPIVAESIDTSSNMELSTEVTPDDADTADDTKVETS